MKRRSATFWRDAAALAVAVLSITGRLMPARVPNELPLAVTEPWQPPSVTPFLTGQAVETQPALSSTGDRIVYVSEDSDNADVWVSDLSGSNRINLTKDFGGQDLFPAWSADGQRIAFYSERGGGGIYTMTASGADVRKVVAIPPSVAYTFSLQWGARGAIVYTNFDEYGSTQVFRVTSAKSRPQCLTCFKTPVRGARAGELSPSGRLLAFVGPSAGREERVSVLDLLTEKTIALPDLSGAPHWASDDRLMFLSFNDGASDVWEVGVDPKTGRLASEPARVTSGVNANQFAVSAGGRRIVAVKDGTTSSLWEFPTARHRIEDISLGKLLTTGTFRDERPRWSIGGREVCFSSDRTGRQQLWTVAAHGGVPELLPLGAKLKNCPRPSPDGRMLAFDSDNTWLWLMRSDGSDAHEAADWRQRSLYVADSDWSPQGSRLVSQVRLFNSFARLGIADVNTASGVVTARHEVDATGADDAYPRWSPDGRSIVCETFGGSWNLWVVDPGGGAGRQVTSLEGNERGAAWQAKPLFVYFIKDQRSVWRVPMSDAFTPSGPPEPWLALSGLRISDGSIDISHDGKRLVAALAKPASDFWLIERK